MKKKVLIITKNQEMSKPHTWHNILPFGKELPVNMSGTTMISYCTTHRDFNSSITGKKYKISTKEELTI